MKLKKLFALALAVCMMALAVPAAFAGEGFLTLEGSGREPVQQAEDTLSLMSTSDEGENNGDAGEETDEHVDNSSVVTTKEVKKDAQGKLVTDADGNYVIRLEAYVTGQTTTTETVKADDMDIILILDTSREMVEKEYSTIEQWESWNPNPYNWPDDQEEVYNESRENTLYYDVDGSENTESDRYPVTVSRRWQSGYIGGSYQYTATYNNGTTDVTINNFQDQTYWFKTTTTIVTGDDSGDTRLDALKTAAIDFIDTIAPDDATENDRRVALISYNSYATVLTGVHAEGSPYADENDAVDSALRPVLSEKDMLEAEIRALQVDTTAAAYCETALYDAKQIFQDGHTLDEPVPTDRPRIVILLSAGIFGPSGQLNNSATDGYTAMDMIWLSVILKADRDTTASIDFRSNFYGFSDNGGDQNDGAPFKANTAYGSDFTGCGATVYCVGLGMPTTEPTGAYTTTGYGTIPSRINEVMYRVSSHRPDGTHTSKNMYNPWESRIANSAHKTDDWEGTYPDALTRNVNKLNSSYTSYFLTVDDASKLSGIFNTISDSIQSGSASVTLDTTTTVTDVVSDYFQLPKDNNGNVITSGIKVYTADYTSSKTWEADVESNLEPEVGDNSVTVSGFDFSKNYVDLDAENGRNENDPSKPGTFYGRKLIIEIPFKAADDFLGGVEVPTNTTGSAIVNGGVVYEEFAPPKVFIPVDPEKVEKWLDWDADITINSQTIYLSNEAVLNGMLTAKAGSKLDGVNNAFVDTVFTVKQGGSVIGTYTVAAGDTVSEGTWAWKTVDNYGTSQSDSTKWAAKALTGCTDYIISCAIDNKPVSSTGVATVHVLKPTVTGISAHIKMGVEAPMAATYQWNTTCGCSGDTPAVTGSIPEVTYDYSKTEENKYPAVCTNYTVSAVIGGTKDAVSGQVTGGTLYTDINNVFTIHVHAPTLTGSVHNVKLGSSTVLDSNDVTLSWKETCITHTAAGSATGDPTPAYSFAGTATRENVTPVECTTYTVELIKIGEVTPASGTYTAPITVHVETPVIEGIDKTIYRGNETEVNAKISDWESCDCEGEIPNATGTPAAKYSFSGGDTVSPEECDEFTATLIKIGNLELEGTKYEDNITDNFLVHVLQPQITANDATIYFGTSIDLDGANELPGVMGGVQWINCCTELPGVSGTEPTPTYSFGVAGKDSYSPSDCTDLTAIWELDEEEFTDDFTVHVVKPAFTTSDTTIYRGNSTDLNSLVEVSNEWKCDRHSDIVLSYTNTPTISYVFEVDGEAVHSTYAPVNCEEVVTKPTIGNKTWNALDAFNVHVLQPTFDVTVQDVWADYTSTFDLTENCIASSVLVWKDMTTGHTTPNTLPADAPTVESSVFTFDKGANGSYTVGTKDDVITVPKMAFSLNNGYGADYTLTDKSSTVHVNKFDLTIEKTWKDGDKDADVTYKQDAIFNLYRVVTDAETGKPVDNLVTQVVLSAKDADGMIVIKDLLCGQNYKVEEQTNWTWRWKANVNGDKENTNVDSEDCSSHTVSASNPHDTTEGKTNPTAHGEKTATFINSLFNRLWLSFCTFVENVFAAMTSQKGGN